MKIAYIFYAHIFLMFNKEFVNFFQVMFNEIEFKKLECISQAMDNNF